nr:hypothetical protein [Candidatus Sigynarchaeota archaeon]
MGQDKDAIDVSANERNSSSSANNENIVIIKLPKPFIPAIHELSRLSKKNLDDLATSYIIAGLQAVCDVRRRVIGMLFNSDILLDQMRNGINDYYGCTKLEQDPLHDDPARDFDHAVIHVSIKLSPRFDNLVDQLCAILNRRREDMFAEFIAWRIEEFYEDEDAFIDSIDGLHALLDGIDEELDSLANTRGNT